MLLSDKSLGNSNMKTLKNISFMSSLGLTHEAMASQKNMKSCTTPDGFKLIMAQTPLNEESFSSLSLMFRRELHLKQCTKTP